MDASDKLRSFPRKRESVGASASPPSRGRAEIWKLKPDVLQLPAGAGTSGRWALRGSAFLDPVFFVAAAAVILADGAERGLEAVEVVHFGDGVLGVGAELGEPRFEVI